jgi:hypothetical protein
MIERLPSFREGRPTVRTIEPHSVMSIGPEFAGTRTRGTYVATLATCAILVLSAVRAGAQTTDATKAPSSGAKSAETLTPAERERLLKEFRVLDRQGAQNYRERRIDEARASVDRALQILEGDQDTRISLAS